MNNFNYICSVAIDKIKNNLLSPSPSKKEFTNMAINSVKPSIKNLTSTSTKYSIRKGHPTLGPGYHGCELYNNSKNGKVVSRAVSIEQHKAGWYFGPFTWGETKLRFTKTLDMDGKVIGEYRSDSAKKGHQKLVNDKWVDVP
jgi:hypothetical protein